MLPCRGAETVRQLPTRGKWWEAAGCVELTERVQLQPHAKLVAIQTEACPAVCSTQPANDLHTLLCVIHTVSRFHSVAMETQVQLSGLPRVFVHALAFSSTPSHANAAEFSSTPSQCHCSCTRSVCSTQPAASHHSPSVCNCLTVVAPRHGAAAPHRAVMGIKRRPVERPVEHEFAEAPRAPRN